MYCGSYIYTMSISLVRKCIQAFNYVYRENPPTRKFYSETVILPGIHLCYVASTERQHTICVKNKYTYTQGGYTHFMVVDTDGNHYNVANSIWYWKWDAMEDWERMPVDQPLLVKYYGVRIPMIGTFPIIVETAGYSEHNEKNKLSNEYVNTLVRRF